MGCRGRKGRTDIYGPCPISYERERAEGGRAAVCHSVLPSFSHTPSLAHPTTTTSTFLLLLRHLPPRFPPSFNSAWTNHLFPLPPQSDSILSRPSSSVCPPTPPRLNPFPALQVHNFLRAKNSTYYHLRTQKGF